MALSSASLIYENAFSIGEKSGEYDGKNGKVHATLSIKAPTSSLL